VTTDYTEPSPSPAAPLPAPATKNAFQRIAGVLFSPGDTFLDIARRPDILVPLVVIIILGYISTSLIMPAIDWEAASAQQIEQVKKQRPNVSEADIERMARFGKAIGTVTAWVAPLLWIVFYVIVAGILLLAFRLFGSEGDFKQSLSTTIYSWLPLAINGVVLGIVAALRGTIDPQAMATLVKSNPAFLVDMKEQPLLFSLLTNLDLFTIWTLALFIIGYSAFTKKSKGMSAAIIVTLWVVLMVLPKLGLAAFAAARMRG